MPDEPFMLVSLEEAKAKKLANVMGNETCTKLLNYLASHSGKTESEIAKAMKLPLSTVHYNLKQLVEARLVVADEFHYSSKGREVLHYRLANKYIIIAPQEEKPGFFDALKKVLPLIGLTLGLGIILSVLSVTTGSFVPPGVLETQAAQARVLPGTSSLPAPGGRALLTSGDKEHVVAAGKEQAATQTAGEAADTNAPSASLSAKPLVESEKAGRAAPVQKHGREGIGMLSWQVIASFVSGGLFVILLSVFLTLLKRRK